MTIKSSSQDNQEESKEPDYDEDQDQLEEEQEEEIGEKAAVATTINEFLGYDKVKVNNCNVIFCLAVNGFYINGINSKLIKE